MSDHSPGIRSSRSGRWRTRKLPYRHAAGKSSRKIPHPTSVEKHGNRLERIHDQREKGEAPRLRPATDLPSAAASDLKSRPVHPNRRRECAQPSRSGEEVYRRPASELQRIPLGRQARRKAMPESGEQPVRAHVLERAVAPTRDRGSGRTSPGTPRRSREGPIGKRPAHCRPSRKPTISHPTEIERDRSSSNDRLVDIRRVV
jgi:hypothetical protein